jgi:hypothetical protein
VIGNRRFRSFIETPPLEGCGWKEDAVRRLIADDLKIRDLWDQAVQRPPYVHADVDNIHVRPTGTSLDATLRRLRKNHPELHGRVLAGELSANAAAIEAGFRKKPVKRCQCGTRLCLVERG